MFIIEKYAYLVTKTSCESAWVKCYKSRNSSCPFWVSTATPKTEMAEQCWLHAAACDTACLHLSSFLSNHLSEPKIHHHIHYPLPDSLFLDKYSYKPRFVTLFPSILFISQINFDVAKISDATSYCSCSGQESSACYC